MSDIKTNGAKPCTFTTCCQNFPSPSQADTWQCQSQYISSCTQALWCNRDLWLRPTTHGISNAHTITNKPHSTGVALFRSVLFFFLWPCQSEPPSAAAPPEAADLLWTLLCLAAQRRSAELSLSRKMDRECCFQQQGFPTHCSLIRDQHSTDLWPQPLTPLWVCFCVCPQGTLNNVGMDY